MTRWYRAARNRYASSDTRHARHTSARQNPMRYANLTARLRWRRLELISKTRQIRFIAPNRLFMRLVESSRPSDCRKVCSRRKPPHRSWSEYRWANGPSRRDSRGAPVCNRPWCRRFPAEQLGRARREATRSRDGGAACSPRRLASRPEGPRQQSPRQRKVFAFADPCLCFQLERAGVRKVQDRRRIIPNQLISTPVMMLAREQRLSYDRLC